MTYQPNQPNQPPVMPGPSPQQPSQAWRQPAPPRPPWYWRPGIIVALIVGTIALTSGIIAAVDRATLTPEEMPDDAKRACTEDYVPAKLAALADPDSARYAAVTVTTNGDAYVVSGRVTADRISTGSLDGVPNRYRFECSLRRDGDAWAPNFTTVIPA